MTRDFDGDGPPSPAQLYRRKHPDRVRAQRRAAKKRARERKKRQGHPDENLVLDLFETDPPRDDMQHAGEDDVM